MWAESEAREVPGREVVAGGCTVHTGRSFGIGHSGNLRRHPKNTGLDVNNALGGVAAMGGTRIERMEARETNGWRLIVVLLGHGRVRMGGC